LKSDVFIRPIENDDLIDCVRDCFEQFGGVESICKGKTFIKFNGTGPDPDIMTNREVILSTVKVVKEVIDPENIYVMENSAVGFCTRLSFEIENLANRIEELGAKPLYLDEQEPINIDFNGIAFDKPIPIPKILYENLVEHKGENTYINIPKLKSHIMCGVTICIKNSHGLVYDAEKIYTEDIKDPNILWALGYNYMFNGQFEEALRYYAIFYETLKSIDQLSVNNMHRIAYVYWQKGFREEAEYYFNEQIKYSNRDNELGQLMSQLLYTYYDLAGTYSFRGEKKKAYENLRIFNQRQIELRWMVTLIKNDPLFDSIRGEPEFQQIIKDVEAKYQTEHERVRQWLEENDML